MEHNREPESLVFINAWNEWGESAALEPDHHFGMGFLEATREAMADVVKRWGGGGEP
jgi:lipopolysaccharide biosynthesis protein